MSARRPLRVMLLNSAAPDRSGGAEVWMRRALGMLAAMGHQATGLAPAGSPALPGGDGSPAEGGPRGHAWDGGLGSLARTLREFRPDVAVAVQHRDLRRLWWAARGTPVRRVMARHLASEKPSWKRRFHYAQLCDAVWTTSEYMRGRLERLDRVAPHRIFVMRPSLPPLPARPEPGGPPTLLCVGRLAPEKGQDVLLLARQRMRMPARLCIIGRGREEAALRSLARSLGLEDAVEWTAHLDDLAPAFAAAHLAVQPSRLEAFGLAALEALARGVPVVGSRVGGLPEVVGEAGELVEPDDPAALAAALDRGLQDGALRAGWSESGVLRARSLFSPAEEARSLERALEGSLP
ncbi:MAG: glycosyltransferase family 4 protein [Candidatus Eisenbacteria bacterium]|nr:glycosyltransferase family 4 protein [Candidatus Eisenbacteria bacterium]